MPLPQPADGAVSTHQLIARARWHNAAIAFQADFIRFVIRLEEIKYNYDQPRVPAGSSDGGQWTGGDAGVSVPPPAVVSPQPVRVAEHLSNPSDPNHVLSDAGPASGIPAQGSGSAGSSNSGVGVGGGAGNVIAVADQQRQYAVVLEEEDKAGLPDPGHTIKKHVGKTDAEFSQRLVAETVFLPFGARKFGPAGIGTFPDVRTANDFVNRTLERNKAAVDKVSSGQLSETYIEERFGYVTGREAFFPGGTEIPEFRSIFAVCMWVKTSNAATGRGYRIDTAFPCNQEKSTAKRIIP